ncbi:MAG: hypothetical protein CO065_14690 [Comamonadaceae bacterium CG_4_9_14_0_8_um_filter_57_21]|nr:MAG: hypothetical protein CO065_14690 [Comamonadaceae bacterium CG_4_9_14_0_8_um_filter_57_21]
MRAAFEKMSQRVLAHLGEDSILRGEVVTPPRKVNIKHGVAFDGYGHGSVASHGDMVVSKSVATILKADSPVVGDTLLHPDGSYVLDVLAGETTFTLQFILRKGA